MLIIGSNNRSNLNKNDAHTRAAPGDPNTSCQVCRSEPEEAQCQV